MLHRRVTSKSGEEVGKLFLLALLGFLLPLACGESPTPTRLPTITPGVAVILDPTPTDVPIPTPTSRPRLRPPVAAFTIPATVAPAATIRPTVARAPSQLALPPAGGAVQSELEARNVAWVYLSRCTPFNPSQLAAYEVENDWYVQAPDAKKFFFGIWRIESATGKLFPHDVTARKWQPYVETGCDPVAGLGVLPTTPTPTASPPPTPTRTPRPTPTLTPIPTATPIVPSTTDAVATLWSYLVKCFRSAELNDFKAVLDPVSDRYVVKDDDEIQYRVWRVDQADGVITPKDIHARRRDETIRGGNC